MSQQAIYESFSVAQVRPLYGGKEALELPINLGPNLTLARGTVLAKAGAAQSAVFTITDTPTITAGTFTITARSPLTGVDVTTDDLAYNIAIADLQTALEAIYGEGNVLVAGGPLPGTDTTITLRADLADTFAETPTIDSTGLTGGTLAITATTVGRSAQTYGAYDDGVLDPAKCVLPVDVVTDAAGLIYLGTSATTRMGGPLRTTPAFFGGYFDTKELVGLDTNGVTDLGKLISGTVADGVLRIL